MKTALPNFSYRLFKWFCNQDLFEELQGDLEEAFFENVELHGVKKARLIYTREVLKMIRPSVTRSLNLIPSNVMRLPKNYLKTSIRAIKLNPFYVFANIFGLALAISICTIGYFNYRFNETFNTHFEEAENIYKIHGLRTGESTLGTNAVALAPLLRESDIDAFRYTARSVAIRERNHLFTTRVAFADESFFKHLPLSSLNGSVIKPPEINEVAISEKLAMKLFNEPYPVGNFVKMVFANQREESFLVKDVFEEPPTNTSFSQSIITSFDNYLINYNVSESDWFSSVYGTFVYAEAGELDQISNELKTLKSTRNASNPNFLISDYTLDNLLVWPEFENYLYRGEFRHYLHPSSVYGITSAAISILLLACFNFINTSIALSGKRLKEIAVRKVMGGNRRSTITQFMIENTFMISIAVMLSIGISSLLIPKYNALFERELIQLDKVPFATLFQFSLILIIIVTLLSAAYPSLHISKFSALKIFKDKITLSGKNRLMVVLLTFQFALCFYNIFGVFLNIDNSYYQNQLDRGYDIEQVVNVPLNSPEQYQVFADFLSQEAQVERVAGTFHLIGFSLEHQHIDQEGIKLPVSVVHVGQNYAEVLGLRLSKGAFFTELGDNSNKILVNSMMENRYGKDLLNKTLTVGNSRFIVIGVVDDFNLRNIMMDNKITPAIIRYTHEENYQYAVARVSGNPEHINREIESVWYKAFPQELYSGFLQTDVLRSSQETNGVMIKINLFLAIISILISILGLYTLISLKVQKRSKEFGVRKVLGASRKVIIHLLGKDLYWILGVAAVVGLSASTIVLNIVFDTIYAYHISPGTEHFIKALLVVFLIVVLTIGYKVYHTSKINLAQQLRSE
ncbi:FtsX-like permease family protein [Ekhidna sp.]|uniref:FtsX-like permease family protein n=1 Tax=Ekhidna sp. TaxID=2608089 RepID=UPI00329A48F4